MRGATSTIDAPLADGAVESPFDAPAAPRRGGQRPARLVRRMRRYGRAVHGTILLAVYRLKGPPRVLTHHSKTNARILKHFGAQVGGRVHLLAPIVLHEAEHGFDNLVIGNGCILNGNNYLDLSARVTLEDGVSLGPGVIVMSHNNFNYNPFLERVLEHQCGVRAVVVRRGAGIKAGAVLTMGVTVGENAVVAAGAVVRRDVADHSFVAGVPAQEIRLLRE